MNDEKIKNNREKYKRNKILPCQIVNSKTEKLLKVKIGLGKKNARKK